MVGCFESVDTMTDYPLLGGASDYTHKEMIEGVGQSMCQFVMHLKI